MGNCISLSDGPKNTGSTNSSDPNGNQNGNTSSKPLPQNKKKKIVIDNSTIDDQPIPHGNSNNKNRDSPLPILLPHEPNFSCSVNGRNGWLVDEVYDFGVSVRFDTFIYFFLDRDEAVFPYTTINYVFVCSAVKGHSGMYTSQRISTVKVLSIVMLHGKRSL